MSGNIGNDEKNLIRFNEKFYNVLKKKIIICHFLWFYDPFPKKEIFVFDVRGFTLEVEYDVDEINKKTRFTQRMWKKQYHS